LVKARLGQNLLDWIKEVGSNYFLKGSGRTLIKPGYQENWLTRGFQKWLGIKSFLIKDLSQFFGSNGIGDLGIFLLLQEENYGNWFKKPF